MMNKTYILAVAALCAGAALRAQNLNPTVEVTRTYESKDLNINKGTVPMNVPDSLLRFDTDFDYSVFGNPYKGAYEFSPYLMNMKPQREGFPGNKLYVRAGAGYAFRPEADIVFSPILDGAFQMSLYGSMRGFFGDWRSVKAERDGVSTSVYDLKGDKGETFSGRDLLVRAGMDGRYGWDRGEVSFDAGYLGIGSKDPLPILRNPVLDKMYNALDLKVRARALGVESGGFYYDAGLGLRFGKDAADGKDLGETVFSFAGSFGPVLRDDMRALVDLKADMAFYSTLVSARGTNIAATPHLQLNRDKLNLDLGFTVGFLFHDDDQLNGLPELYTQKGQVFYPAVHASYQAIEQRLNLYADVTGGARLNTYSSLLEDNHRLVTAMCQDPTTSLLDNTVERINLRLGLRGQVLGRLHYDLSGGFASVAGGLVDAMVDVNEHHQLERLQPHLCGPPGCLELFPRCRGRRRAFQSHQRLSAGLFRRVRAVPPERRRPGRVQLAGAHLRRHLGRGCHRPPRRHLQPGIGQPHRSPHSRLGGSRADGRVPLLAQAFLLGTGFQPAGCDHPAPPGLCRERHQLHRRHLLQIVNLMMSE